MRSPYPHPKRERVTRQLRHASTHLRQRGATSRDQPAGPYIISGMLQNQVGNRARHYGSPEARAALSRLNGSIGGRRGPSIHDQRQ